MQLILQRSNLHWAHHLGFAFCLRLQVTINSKTEQVCRSCWMWTLALIGPSPGAGFTTIQLEIALPSQLGSILVKITLWILSWLHSLLLARHAAMTVPHPLWKLGLC